VNPAEQNNADVAIVATGAANLASVLAAFTRLGVRPRVTRDPAVVAAAPMVVLPGVGAFGHAMQRLEDEALVQPLRDRIAQGLPLLAICLGMQLLCEGSEESPGVQGLGTIPLRVERFAPAADQALRVPQMGWNRIEPDPQAQFLQSGYMYFANSYRLRDVPAGWCAATSEYAGRFVAALERGGVLACQFHPELSGRAGADLLARWVSRSLREVARC
jgi:imidazole glycerol phosphate synthase glutamine amidotransferase subunit